MALDYCRVPDILVIRTTSLVANMIDQRRSYTTDRGVAAVTAGVILRCYHALARQAGTLAYCTPLAVPTWLLAARVGSLVV